MFRRSVCSPVVSRGWLALFVIPGAIFAQIYATNLPYVDAPADNVVSRLDVSKLEHREDGLGYLPSLLERLGIPQDSQALVFSKTSFQSSRISPRNPRAIYFNDEVAVGWVRGGDGIEIAATDPKLGIAFYTLKDRLERQQVCLKCHHGAATLGVAGIFIGSVYPNASGMPDRLGAIITDHRTAFEDRWGGWYVTSRQGEQRDRANSVAPDPAEPHELRTDGRQNLTSLVREFSLAGYLQPTSDIVALMTFEHQTQMINFFTRLSWESRRGEDTSADLEAALAYMLFVDEAPMREPIVGVSTFTETFPKRGPRDHKGRSLRDFDLKTRLFRYPLSYMIYTPSYRALPDAVRGRLMARLDEVLTGKDQSPKFARLTAEGRRNILEILRDTQ